MSWRISPNKRIGFTYVHIYNIHAYSLFNYFHNNFTHGLHNDDVGSRDPSGIKEFATGAALHFPVFITSIFCLWGMFSHISHRQINDLRAHKCMVNTLQLQLCTHIPVDQWTGGHILSANYVPSHAKRYNDVIQAIHTAIETLHCGTLLTSTSKNLT